MHGKQDGVDLRVVGYLRTPATDGSVPSCSERPSQSNTGLRQSNLLTQVRMVREAVVEMVVL